MSKFFYSVLFLLALQQANAQLLPNSIAPDFTATDIDGKTWRLYDLLDQGKTVVIDISATWCVPCWNYHQSKALEELYAKYGPAGTQEMMVFLVEGDELTDLADLHGTGDNTVGDWVAGTEYPIIDSRAIAEAYEISYFPTVYMICPNRIVSEIGQLATEDIHTNLGVCVSAAGLNNGAAIKYTGFEGDFCEKKTFAPAFYFQNLGTAPITAATIELWLNGTLSGTINWTGNLNTYGLEPLTFPSMTFAVNTDIDILVKDVNGVADDHPLDNQLHKEIRIAPDAHQNRLSLEMKLDQYPGTTYWEIINSAGIVLHYGGNRGYAYPGESTAGAYTTANALIRDTIPLANNDCYEFHIVDGFGDGLCCKNGLGYFRLKDESGNILAEGGQFLDEDRKPFGLHNSPGIPNNATILSLGATPAEFCDHYTFKPTVQLRNSGSNPITALQILVEDNGNPVQTFDWTGNIPALGAQTVTLNALTVNQSTTLTYKITAVNQVPDQYPFNNTIAQKFQRHTSSKNSWLVDIQTDAHAYETYWEIADANGAVVAWGGNAKVGPNGGGKKIAQADDPGVYEANKHYVVPVTIPGGGCYELRVADDNGNGMYQLIFGLPSPYIRVRNPQEGLITGTDGNFTNDFRSKIDALLPLGTGESALAQQISVTPNPASESMEIRFELPEPMRLQLTLVDLQGHRVWQQASEGAAGTITVPVAGFPNGIYLLQVASAGGVAMKKVVVER